MSFTAETRDRTRPILPLAAMIDVLFLLLIFFMTASVFREQEMQIHVNLPPAESAQAAPGLATQIVIHITEENRVYLGAREVVIGELRDRLAELHVDSPGETVVIRGDTVSNFGTFIAAFDAARHAGFAEVQFHTARRNDEQSLP